MLSSGNHIPRIARRTSLRGAVLVEFTIGMFVVLLFVYAAVDLMRVYLSAQVVGEASRIVAREAATIPHAASQSEADFKRAIYDPVYSAIDLDTMFIGDLDGDDLENTPADRILADTNGDGAVELDELFATLPPAHSALRSVMYREIWIENGNSFLPLALAGDTVSGGTRRRLLRLPGALFWNPNLPHGQDLNVLAPLIDEEGDRGYGTTDEISLNVVPLVAGLVPDDSGVIRAHIFYQFSFFTLMDIRGSGVSVPVQHNPNDQTKVNFGNFTQHSKRVVNLDASNLVEAGVDPADGWIVVDYGLSRWLGVGNRNPFRNFSRTIRMDAASRRMLPGP